MKRLIIVLLTLSLLELSSTLENRSIDTFDEDGPGLIAHNYPSVIVFKFGLRTDKFPDKWTDNCENTAINNLVRAKYENRIRIRFF